MNATPPRDSLRPEPSLEPSPENSLAPEGPVRRQPRYDLRQKKRPRVPMHSSVRARFQATNKPLACVAQTHLIARWPGHAPREAPPTNGPPAARYPRAVRAAEEP